jgi:hypothetical protein
VWETTVNGRQLHFHLAGINNQNFIMRDEETGSWWQQVSGEAIFGPAKGQKLRSVFVDEVTFGLWKKEHPGGRVQRPDPSVAANNYAPADWETKMAKARVVIAQPAASSLTSRQLVVGLKSGSAAKAYPIEALAKQGPIIDEIAGAPVVLVLGDDKKSVRAFERVLDGRKLELFMKQGSAALRLLDAETGSEWDFSGKAISGQLSGRQLKRVPVLLDYWFDWKTYNPNTTVYDLGNR